jgi:hypothetical protein
MSKRGRHTSVDSELRPAITWLEKLSAVKKVFLGRAESCRHRYSPGTLRVVGLTESGFRLKAYSGRGVQEIAVAILPLSERERIIELIEERCR